MQNDAPGLKVYSKEDIQNNPGIAYSGGRSPRDPDYDDDEDYDEDEGDVDEGQVSATRVETYSFALLFFLIRFFASYVQKASSETPL